MGESPKELHERYEETGRILRSFLPDLPSKFTKLGKDDIGLMASISVKYGEAVVAMLLDAVQRYTDAAAKDRESSARDRDSREKDRQAQALAREAHESRDDKHMVVQRWQGWIMMAVTVGILASTAIYTWAAVTQIHLMEHSAITQKK